MSQSIPLPDTALSIASPAAAASSSIGTASLESIISDITSFRSDSKLHVVLSSHVKRDVGETILASTMPGGYDPLSILDAQTNTLGYLYILTARLNISGSSPVSLPTISHFCHTFNAESARLAPDRITMLARSIVHLAESQNNLKAAIPALYDLTTRYPPSLSYLTTIHQHFLHACVASQHFTIALPVLSVTISEIDTSLSPLTYHDVLNYHYTGALALLALKRFSEAAKFLELVAAAPAQLHPAALQLEALKKLVLVRLILHGATRPLPKYAHPNLWRYLKSTPYATLANKYPSTPARLAEFVEKEAKVFEPERNMGLVRQVVEHAPRWAVRKLTATYLTLSLAEIGKAIGIADEEAVREIVLSMIECHEMNATLDVSGTVTFHEDETRYTGGDVDNLLGEAQSQGATLVELDREVGRSKEFLTKILKEKDGGLGMGMVDEDLYTPGGPPGYRDWDDGGF